MTSALDLFRGSLCALALLALFAFPLGAQEPAPAPAPAPAVADPEARLLEGELLELAEGRIDEAVEIYRALLATSDLSPSLRARALFSIARAHRKRGELGAAKESYEKLVAEHADQEKLVEASRRYLDEIAEGAARLPEFDWVTEVEQNPQIQAQIFEWGMQLAWQGEEAQKAADQARRKLLALGVLVIPVLEPMLESSRDAAHREELARILISLGRLDHIGAFVEADSSNDRESWLRWCIEPLDPARRSEALRVLSSLPVEGKPREERLVAAVRLTLGDTSRLEDDIRTLVRYGALSVWDPDTALRDPASLARARDLLLEVEQSSSAEYLWLLEQILARAPELVLPEHLRPLADRVQTPRRDAISNALASSLFEHHREELLRLFEGPNSVILLEALSNAARVRSGSPTRETSPFFWRRFGPSDWQYLGGGIAAEQKARILRAARRFDSLVALAVDEDAAIPELSAFLLRRAEESDPQDPWLGTTGRVSVFQTAAWAQSISPDSTGHRGPSRVGRPSGGRVVHTNAERVSPPDPAMISPALEAAMREVFRGTTDVDARSTALELLVRAYPGGLRESAELFRSIIEDAEAEPAHRIIAFVGLLLRLPDAGDDRDSDAELLDRFFSGPELEIEPILNGGQWQRLVLACHALLWFDRDGKDVISNAATAYVGLLESDPTSRIIWDRAGAAVVEALVGGHGIAIFRKWSESSHKSQSSWGAQFDAASDRIGSAAVLQELAPVLLDHGWDPPPLRLWNRLVTDPSVPPDIRGRILEVLVTQFSNPGMVQRQFLDALDWRALLVGEDPLAGAITARATPCEPYLRPHRLAARASPQVAVQRWAWEDAELPAALEELEPALGSPDETVRRLGYRCLLRADDTRWLPALHRAAREAPTDLRSEAIDRLAFFAAEESLPVLTALLDDPVFAVRAKALEALEKIEVTLSQQEKWRERFGKKKD